tara:strand:- start:3787 stop:4530 length:744 start_codon:yes stop_codon:yes gene_type:complete
LKNHDNRKIFNRYFLAEFIMLSIIIPVYNEELIIEKTVHSMLKELYKNKIKFEIVLVNNGSFDNTQKILNKLKTKNIRILKLKINQTFGGGVIAGLSVAKGSHVAITCADNQVKPPELIKIYKIAIKRKLDFCKGDRRLKYKKWFRRYASRAYKFLVMALFTLKINDINGYPIIMKRNVYKNIDPRLKNWTINVEMLYKAKKKNYKVVEIPVEHGERIGGKSNVGFDVIWSMFVGLLKYKIKTLKNG